MLLPVLSFAPLSLEAPSTQSTLSDNHSSFYLLNLAESLCSDSPLPSSSAVLSPFRLFPECFLIGLLFLCLFQEHQHPLHASYPPLGPFTICPLGIPVPTFSRTSESLHLVLSVLLSCRPHKLTAFSTLQVPLTFQLHRTQVKLSSCHQLHLLLLRALPVH